MKVKRDLKKSKILNEQEWFIVKKATHGIVGLYPHDGSDGTDKRYANVLSQAFCIF